MSIRLQPRPWFSFSVDLLEPGAERPTPVKFTGKHVRQDEIQALFDRMKDAAGNDAKFLLLFITGWDVVDENGKTADFTEANVEEFLKNYLGAALPIWYAWLNALSGGRIKNS